MKYSTDEEPKIGDHVLGDVKGARIAGQVSAIGKERIVIASRGPAMLAQAMGRKEYVKGAISYIEGQAEDFELLYRKPSLQEAK